MGKRHIINSVIVFVPLLFFLCFCTFFAPCLLCTICGRDIAITCILALHTTDCRSIWLWYHCDTSDIAMLIDVLLLNPNLAEDDGWVLVGSQLPTVAAAMADRLCARHTHVTSLNCQSLLCVRNGLKIKDKCVLQFVYSFTKMRDEKHFRHGGVANLWRGLPYMC